MPNPDIEIFYCSVCGLCTKAIEFLRSRNLDFTAYAVEWDSQSDAFRDSSNVREMFRRCGETVDIVPQFFIRGTHVAGWRRLEPMIADGSFDQLLK